MAQNYIRQSSFTDGDTITAGLFNNEYNQLVNAFAYSSIDANATGHTHDGSLGQGGNISKIGDLDFLNKIEIDGTNNRMGFFVEVGGVTTEQVRISDGLIVPVTTNDIDLGSASLQFKDAYFDGTVNIDSLVADTADINGGTLDAVTIGATTAAEITGTTITYGSLSDGTITITAFVDEDDMVSDSATLVPTQQSVKAYVDAQVTAQDLDFQGDTGGALSIDLDSETLTIAGGTGIDTAGATNTLTVSIDSTVTTLTGTQTLTNKTIDADNNTVSNLEVDNLKTGVLDTDISSVAVTHTTLPSALAVKTYVDTQVTAQDLDIVGDTGTDAIDLDSETLTFTGGTGITSVVTAGTVTHNIDSTVATLTGTQTLTNKTISASSNTISNLNTTHLASGVLDTDLNTVSSLHDTIPSAKAVYDYVADLASSSDPIFTGTVTADNVTINGNTILGSDTADTVTINADVASDLIPSVDGTYDLGASGAEWQDLFIDGTANIDSLVADTVDINGGTIDGTVIGGTTAAAGSFTNITVSGTVDGRDVAADGTKLDGIEALADVTDTANVTAAGAVMESDSTTALMSFVIDEDSMVSNLATKVPTQQSVKAYVDANSAEGALADLTDTTITSIAANEVLKWSGTAWINNTLAEAGIQPLATVLTNTTASYTTAEESKLGGIEALADVTDATNVVAALSGATLTGELIGGDQTVSRVNLKDYGEVTNAIGSTGGGTQDIDLTLGNSVSATVDTSANTFTFSNPTASDELCGFTLYLVNGGSQTVTWPASVDWPGGTAPTLTASGTDKLVFETIDGGTTWLGNLVGAAYA
jgi:hypothetical protein